MSSDIENKTLTELEKQATYLEIAGANSSINNPSHEKISEVSTAGPSTSNLEVKMDSLMDILERNLACEEPDEQLNYAGRADGGESGSPNWNLRPYNDGFCNDGPRRGGYDGPRHGGSQEKTVSEL